MRLNDCEVKHKQCGIDKLGSLGAVLDWTRLVRVVPESKLALASIAIGMIPEVMSADCTRPMDDQRSHCQSHRTGLAGGLNDASLLYNDIEDRASMA